MDRDAIGGYLELELPSGNGELFPHALRFQSARAAFLALLNAGRPKSVWMPWYNCETMLEPPAMAGISIRRYSIDEKLEISDDLELGGSDWLLYVNYFGLCNSQIERLFARFPREQIVIDNSQALFAPARDGLATLYSPRKFFGIPDGGYLITRLAVSLPDEQDDGSIARLRPLLTRLDRGAEAGYDGILAARATLRGQTPKRMSTLTQRLLEHIDYPIAVRRRNHNFARYHRLLGNENHFSSASGPIDGPMCYPFWNRQANLHTQLAARRVYVGRYWPNMRGASGTPDDLEYRLANECLALPCDQRYCDREIDFVVRTLRDALMGR